jgi:hypothetical protein
MLTTDFNIENYHLIIKKIIDRGYKFVKYPQEGNTKISGTKEVLLRHDIDFSLSAAGQIAQQDYNLQVQSVFFVYLNSPFYNILFEDDKKRIDEIMELGHEVALHFDERINIDISKEIDILTKIFPGVRTDFISLHRPKIDQQTKTLIKSDVIPEYIKTTYDNEFFKHIEYISDSRCNFDETRLDAILNSARSFQLLLHPVWWHFAGSLPEEKLRVLCDGKLNEVKDNIRKNVSIKMTL